MIVTKTISFIYGFSPKLLIIRKMSNCIFCKIIAGDEPSDIHYQDEQIIVFKDIKPATKLHFLSVPKQHVNNVNTLTKDDIPLVQQMVECGKKVIQEKGGDINDIRFGFHTPPFNSIGHLHLHVISPASEMGILSRVIFNPNTWWFSSVDQILEKLEKSTLENKL